MIVGMNTGNTALQTVLAALQTSTFTFQLTGSRYFQTHSEYSDYDFFVQDDLGSHYGTSSVRGFLYENDFSHEFVSNMDYSDDKSVNDVYKHSCGVHIQIVKDFKVKEAAQIELFVNGVGLYLRDKSFAKVLWKMAITFAERNKPVKPITASYLFNDDALAIIREVYPVFPGFGKTNSLSANKISAIGLHRRLTGMGLRESKDEVESLLK